ncbi:MAG: hypothetical protein DKM50_09710 [Candidatus Margulisiibacteriota bacterium]|nr:MAG: hypothetical protein A2X43_10170 [Candidatus Margulisbacteria bacterium GWD2_39_127]OGI01509.1 MAG: hypothetical protein A2X42_12000 [Candidatus Margulisbacteria bacterium GWF2_38_17]OGI11322.1 MAG: hypothetical protein A2X41_04350 [Candidatus Margulisbacteria bacterium GWE2_39_32]PZM78981.1 MAG: hypothetical protein DKM50_09710 [Candidatus Margulisiibacteriota bacterium]HAR64418.1 hypothetical protein [Candidatus Margulisiibacteriota bacterium]
MSVKAYIAALSIVITETIRHTCLDINIEPVVMKNLSNLMEELKEAKPSIIFLQASIIEEAEENLITKLKEDETLGEAYIIVNAVRIEGAEFAYQIGADAFLPIPFNQTHLESILRYALNLPKKLLIVSKKENESSNFYHALKGSNFSLIVAKSGQKGIEVTKNQFPDMILCDLEIDDISAYEFCKTIKSSKLFLHIPLAILSPQNDAKTVEQCFEAGAHEILLPPYESKYNLKKIASIISPLRGRKEKALVVDDSIVIRNLISKMFKQLGFIVITAINGEEGLKVALKEKPDIITSDYDMPVMDGWGFCSELKNNDITKDIPIIMISSRNSETDLKKAELLEVSGYLTKPFNTQDLQKTIKKAISDAKTKKEQKTLAKYISADTFATVQEQIEHGRNIEPQEKFITILFSDVCEFSTKCERLDPQKIVLLLNNYFQSMVDILLKYDAIIDKFIGDAIVARFDSGDKKKDALDAVKSALAMLDALEIFNQSSFEAISIRIGINSGEAILGNIGCEKHRLDYTMIGDKVNIAERLQKQANEQGCLIADTTYQMTKNSIEVGDIQELTLKGKQEVVKAYSLIRLNNDSSLY